MEATRSNKQGGASTMDVEINPPLSNEVITSDCDNTMNINNIIEYLITNENIYFKNQQRNETDLTSSEKKLIAREVFDKSKSSFLVRFGKFLKQDQLNFFRQYAEGDDDEVQILLNNLSRFHNTNKSDGIQLETKNRRYEALKQLIQGNSYFTETEMMKRNPLLYHQLVGQYLSEEERTKRDRNEDNYTLVKILMEGIERDEAERKMRLQQEEEYNAMEESDSDKDEMSDKRPQPPTARWGEFQEMQIEEPIGRSNVRAKPKEVFITSEERHLLKHEFITLMYQSFLDGKDDFDYATIDNNDEYDNIEILEHDEEDRYFDSEEPEDLKMQENEELAESSEDELDIYMNALNQHPAVCELSKDLEKL